MSAQAALYGGMAALELAGGYFASQNIKATAQLNKEISDMNSEFAELDAYDAEIEGFNKKTRYQGVIDNALADQTAMLEAQGVDTSFGSAASIKAETKFVGELNLMEIQKQAQEQALGYKRQARSYRLGGALEYGDAMFRSGQALASGITGAAKSGLTGYERSK